MARSGAERADLLAILGEVFREHGYEGASLALIGARTGLGKGSLYHHFPGGKEEMAAAVLDGIDAWFETEIFQPLREEPDPRAAIAGMCAATEGYFRSGRRVCLVGVLALGEVRDRFAERIEAYFAAWCDALALALRRAGAEEAEARDLSEEAVAAIQGGLVAARALRDPELFTRLLARLSARLALAGRSAEAKS